MNNADMLARLIGQAEGQGSDLVTLRAMIEEASDLGTQRALERLGLADIGAADDVRELRDLLAAWRDAKRGLWKAVLDWALRGGLALVLVGLAVKLGLSDLLRPELLK